MVNGLFADGDRTARLSNVALLYYGEGLTQSEIAKRLQVSRATVVNLLREARDQGIVEIRVGGQHLTESALARQLCEAYGLQDVYISNTFEGPGEDRAADLRQLGRVSATAFLDIVAPGDHVGVAWGETISALSEELPRVQVENVEVSQLIGSMMSNRVPASEYCTIRIAGQIGAQCYTLHAPALASTAELAALFRSEPVISAQLDRLRSLDMVAFSVGNTSDDTHMAAAGMTSAKELRAARDHGAQGILCCRFVDAGGSECAYPPSDRLIAADLESLRRAPKRLLAVCGKDRTNAVSAALAGGFVTHLCVDQGLAGELLMLKG